MSMFHERLKLLRNESGETQARIADAIGVTPQVLSLYFNNREPNFDILCKIAQHFNVSTDYLLGISNAKNTDETLAINTAFSNTSATVQKLYFDVQTELLNCVTAYNFDLSYPHSQKLMEYVVCLLKKNISLYREIVKDIDEALIDPYQPRDISLSTTAMENEFFRGILDIANTDVHTLVDLVDNLIGDMEEKAKTLLEVEE